MNKKYLITYYSWSDNTKRVAKNIAAQLPNSNLAEIKVAPDVFSEDMYETFDISKEQIATNNYPDIDISIDDFNQYDLILVGSPIWGGKPATPIYTFLKKLNGYKGKVASFYTDVGSIEDYDKVFKQWADGLDVLPSGHGDRKLDEWTLTLQ
ncbi:flavodoxin [Lactobacillus sp.]|uniref:flavodoxin family protein n=1 Tax=Lactobacillus sp. TaxID=1591 RepID=UPI0019C10CA1|nr:flavodoxin [Lactobacillus sp.]MBD5430202.1 transcriptional regulator [Lactobacillus sp.]